MRKKWKLLIQVLDVSGFDIEKNIEVANQYSPDYDADKVFRALTKDRQDKH